MSPLKLNKILSKVFNTYGNRYITENFIEGPYQFDVKIKDVRLSSDLFDYLVEIYTYPEFPESLTYKPELNKIVHGAHISVIRHKFKEIIKFVYPAAGTSGNHFGIEFLKKQDTSDILQESIAKNIEKFAVLFSNLFEVLYQETYDEYDGMDENIRSSNNDTLLLYMNGDGDVYISSQLIDKIYSMTDIEYFFRYGEKRETLKQIVKIFVKNHFGWDAKNVFLFL